MTPEEARELFSEAEEGTLASERKQAFRALLAKDSELAAEFAAFCATLAAVRSAGTLPAAGQARPNLLPGVQRRLRARSRGRFYADRFAESAGGGPIAPLLWALLVLALIAVAWFGMGLLDVATPVK